MKKLTHKTRLSWLFQLTSPVYLLLATLPQGDAAQVKSPEKPQLRLEVASNKLEGAKCTTQVALTNLSIAAIGPTQYSLVVREKHGQAVKVYYQNTTGQIMELALEEPTDLAALIGADTLHTGAVGTFTLILKPSQDTGHVRLMFSIEDAQKNPVSEPASVTWRLKRYWTLPKVFISAGLIAAATVLMIMLRHYTNSCPDTEEDKYFSACSHSDSESSCTDTEEDEYFSACSHSDPESSCTASPAAKLRRADNAPELRELRKFRDPCPGAKVVSSTSSSTVNSEEQSRGTVDPRFLEGIMNALINIIANIKSKQDAFSQLNTLKELMSMPGAKQQIEELNKQIGPDPTLDKLLRHWINAANAALGICWIPWVGGNKIQAVIRSLGLEELLAKLLRQYDKDISPATRSKAEELLAQGRAGES
ncbi:MAG: hypothetical protein AAF400_02220 [Bacteroidota bacterium]